MSFKTIIDRPAPRAHMVQFYKADHAMLATNVTQYLWEGARRGDGLLVIAGRQHAESFRQDLTKRGADLGTMTRSKRIAFFDAPDILARVMTRGRPSWDLFREVIASAMGEVRPLKKRAAFRVYGEIVGILWKARNFSAAIQIEQFTNRLLANSSSSLLCGYPIDVLGDDFQGPSLDALLCTHTHLLPTTKTNLGTAINRAMDDVLGSSAARYKVAMRSNRPTAWAMMPTGEAKALWLRNHLPRFADEILDLAQSRLVH
jgi:hypothetical protein